MEDNVTQQITIKLSGDDFTNPDGTSRQEYLKLAYDNRCGGDWELAPFHYSGKETFAVLYNGNCIGTVPQKRYVELRSIFDKITHLSVSVREYSPDTGRVVDPSAAKHYQAYLSVDYKAEVSASFAPPASAVPEPLPASAHPSAPRKSGTNWVTPLIGILILLAAIAASAFSRKAPDPVSPALPVITSDTQLMSVDELHARFKRALDAAAPGSYTLDVDKDALTITVTEWSPRFNAAAVNECLRSGSKLDTWKKILSAASDLSADLQQQLDNHGHPEYTVSLSIVNPDDFSQIFATVERGGVLYDIVGSTGPGEEIPDPLRFASSGSAISYIVNLSTNVFHFPDCPALDRLSSSNRSVFTGDRADLLSQGYVPCGQCKP